MSDKEDKTRIDYINEVSSEHYEKHVFTDDQGEQREYGIARRRNTSAVQAQIKNTSTGTVYDSQYEVLRKIIGNKNWAIFNHIRKETERFRTNLNKDKPFIYNPHPLVPIVNKDDPEAKVAVYQRILPATLKIVEDLED